MSGGVSKNALMSAVVAHRYGPPDVLRIEQVPPPVPAAGEVPVRVVAVGLNVTDAQLRAGGAKSWFDDGPWIWGWDIAGDVVGVGAGAAFAVGDPVLAMPRFPGARERVRAVRHLPGRGGGEDSRRRRPDDGGRNLHEWLDRAPDAGRGRAQFRPADNGQRSGWRCRASRAADSDAPRCAGDRGSERSRPGICARPRCCGSSWTTARRTCPPRSRAWTS